MEVRPTEASENKDVEGEGKEVYLQMKFKVTTAASNKPYLWIENV